MPATTRSLSGSMLHNRLTVMPSMAGLVPAIHVVDAATEYAWMPGTGPGMTTQDVVSVCAKRMGTTFRVGELADFDRRLAALERMVEDAKSQPPGEMTRSVR